MLEALQYKDNAFLTLTYGDEHLPKDGSVDSIVLQLFIKRLRKSYATKAAGTFRYYACGEYGEDTNRPHYHLALFNFPSCLHGQTRIHRTASECCVWCTLVSESWGFGHVYLGSLTTQSAAYIAGYVTKKFITHPDGVRPPFSRMSNRPGIGAGAMDEVASTLLMEGYKQPDVPTSLQHGSSSLPLGRYLRRRLRLRIGRAADAPQETLQAMEDELRPLREKAFAYAPLGAKTFAFKQEVINSGTQKRAKQKFWQSVNLQKRKAL